MKSRPEPERIPLMLSGSDDDDSDEFPNERGIELTPLNKTAEPSEKVVSEESPPTAEVGFSALF
jgi:hypothetical protein